MTVGILANLSKEDVRKLVPGVLRWLYGKGIKFLMEPELADKLGSPDVPIQQFTSQPYEKQCDVVLSFGGDGTILSTARKVGRSGVPILGVKIGGMGFLAESNPDELYSNLEKMLNERYCVTERLVLQAIFEGRKDPVFVLNDFVVDKGAASRVIRVKTFIDDEYLNTYIGDGLIVATPTGSTAYSLAVGGPILLPSMDAIIINPISPHTLTARPVVVPGDREIKIEVEASEGEVPFSGDGQPEIMLKGGQIVRIKRADYTVKLVSGLNRGFHDVLRSKLHWGEDIREG